MFILDGNKLSVKYNQKFYYIYLDNIDEVIKQLESDDIEIEELISSL
jgi:hypothetical protein